jgi:hypothetical protein
MREFSGISEMQAQTHDFAVCEAVVSLDSLDDVFEFDGDVFVVFAVKVGSPLVDGEWRTTFFGDNIDTADSAARITVRDWDGDFTSGIHRAPAFLYPNVQGFDLERECSTG